MATHPSTHTWTRWGHVLWSLLLSMGLLSSQTLGHFSNDTLRSFSCKSLRPSSYKTLRHMSYKTLRLSSYETLRPSSYKTMRRMLEALGIVFSHWDLAPFDEVRERPNMNQRIKPFERKKEKKVFPSVSPHVLSVWKPNQFRLIAMSGLL